MASENLETIGKDTDSDIPDDFFDDFGRDEFMSGLDIVDSVDSFDEAITKGTSSEDYVKNFVESSEIEKKTHEFPRKGRHHNDSPHFSSRGSPHERSFRGGRGSSFHDYRGRRDFRHGYDPNSQFGERFVERNRKRHFAIKTRDRTISDYWVKAGELGRSHDHTLRKTFEDEKHRSKRINQNKSSERNQEKDDKNTSKNFKKTNLDKSLERSMERDFVKKDPPQQADEDLKKTYQNKSHEEGLENISMDKSIAKSIERGHTDLVILPGSRRDFLKTKRAIEIDKDKKAKDLLEKRVRIVETGLVPPGMEAEVILNERPIGRAADIKLHMDTEKISPTPMVDEVVEHVDHHTSGRSPHRSDGRNNHNERFSRERRYNRDNRRHISPRPHRRIPSPRLPRRSISPRLRRSSRSPRLRRHSPRRRSGDISRPDSRNSRDERHSRPRSPFIKEITRKLRERSQEKHMMKMLNQPSLPSQDATSYPPQNVSEYRSQITMNNDMSFVGPHNGPYNSTMPIYAPYDGSTHPYPASYFPPQYFPVQYPAQNYEIPQPGPVYSTDAYPTQPVASYSSPSVAPFVRPALIDCTKLVEPVPPPQISPIDTPRSKTDSSTTLSLDDLLLQKQINVADYLKLKMKPTPGGPNNEKSALTEKIELISRCQNAVLKLNQFRKPNNLVYNPELEENVEVEEINTRFQSPFKKKNHIQYSYTSPLTFSKPHNERLLNNIIATIGLQDFIKLKKEAKPIPSNMKDVAVQTNTFPCDICEIRKSSKFKTVGTAADDLYETCSVHSQVNESELQISKSMYVAGQSASHNPVSLTHLTPSQILANDLAAKARALRNIGGQPDAVQLSNLVQNINLQRFYQGFQQATQNPNNYNNTNNQYPQGYRY